MRKSKVEWNAQVAAYQSSGKSLAQYCKDANVKLSTLRHHVYNTKPKLSIRSPKTKFYEVPLVSELVITRTSTGEIGLRGFDVADLPALIKAWSHAL